MWRDRRRKVLAVLAGGVLLAGIAGCSSTPAPPVEKAAVMRHGVVNLPRLLETHPEREKLRELEQSLAEAAADNKRPQVAMEGAKKEFETAMEARRHQDNAALTEKEALLRKDLGERRRLFIEALEAEYRPILFNLDLKMKTVKLTPAETEALQKERAKVEAERQQKLSGKDAELAALLHQEMTAYVATLSAKSQEYANQWMDDRMKRLQAEAVKPDMEKRRQEFVELSGKILQDVRQAVAKVAAQERLDIVWTRLVARREALDITDPVAREISK